MNEQSYAEKSKLGWHTGDGSNPNTEQLKLGCMQRIASACELMAKDRARMVDDLEYYKKRCNDLQQRLSGKDNTIRALRGLITVLKKHLDKVET